MTTDSKATDSRRIAARNATTHGLFARDVVLPRLGEDPQAYEAFLAELTSQLQPKNLLEQHYAEKIAAASWRLRRLHRWQAQLFEDAELPEDEVMLRMDRLMRHETALHRQIDTSVRMLGRELPKLFEGRVREDLVRRLGETERTCQDDPYLDQWVTEETRRRSALPTAPPSLDLSRLDTTSMSASRQNEPAPATGHPLPEGEVGRLAEPEGSPQSRRDFPSLKVSPALQSRATGTECQNEPTPCHPSSPCSEGEAGRGFPSPCSEGPRTAPVLVVARDESEGVPTPTPPELGAGGPSSSPHPGEMDLQKLRDWATMRTSDFGERLMCESEAALGA